MSIPRADRPTMPGYGLEPPAEGDLLPFGWAEDRLAASRNYWVSTLRPDGRPHAMPVWAVWVEGGLWFNTGSESRKTRNLRASPWCVVTTESADECAIVEGRAERRDDAAKHAPFIAAYKEKYEMDLSEWPHPTFVVRPKVVFGFIEAAEHFGKTATRWTFA